MNQFKQSLRSPRSTTNPNSIKTNCPVAEGMSPNHEHLLTNYSNYCVVFLSYTRVELFDCYIPPVAKCIHALVKATEKIFPKKMVYFLVLVKVGTFEKCQIQSFNRINMAARWNQLGDNVMLNFTNRRKGGYGSYIFFLCFRVHFLFEIQKYSCSV